MCNLCVCEEKLANKAVDKIGLMMIASEEGFTPPVSRVQCPEWPGQMVVGCFINQQYSEAATAICALSSLLIQLAFTFPILYIRHYTE